MTTVREFSEVRDEFLRVTGEIVFCTATTVDSRGRPRNRVLHPIFIVDGDRPLGWAVTGRTAAKTRHLALNPHVACSFWSPSQDTVFVDCVATWADDEAELERVWQLFLNTPTPLGWAPRAWPASAPTAGATRSSPRSGWSPGGCR